MSSLFPNAFRFSSFHFPLAKYSTLHIFLGMKCERSPWPAVRSDKVTLESLFHICFEEVLRPPLRLFVYIPQLHQENSPRQPLVNLYLFFRGYLKYYFLKEDCFRILIMSPRGFIYVF